MSHYEYYPEYNKILNQQELRLVQNGWRVYEISDCYCGGEITYWRHKDYPGIEIMEDCTSHIHTGSIVSD